MYSKAHMYSFTGSHLHVLKNQKSDLETGSPLHDHIKTSDGQIYLGHFLNTIPVVWKTDVIQNGLAIFEYGKVEFPNFREIRIWVKEPPPVPTIHTISTIHTIPEHLSKI